MTRLFFSAATAVWVSFTLVASQSSNYQVINLQANDTIAKLKSENYPYGSVSYKNYQYIITSSLDVVQLKVVEFSLPISYDNSYCTMDYVYIYDAGDITSDNQIATWCRTVKAGTTIISSGSTLTIWFHTTSNKMFLGFNLEYRSMKHSDICGDTNLFASGYTRSLQSPNYPYFYTRNTTCQWLIKTNTSTDVISLVLENDGLSLENNLCAFDNVSIYDGNSTASPRIALLCSQVSGGSFTSTGNSLTVVFNSDNSVAGRGFKFWYSSMRIPDSCTDSSTSLYASEDTRSLTSPSYPHNYANNEECTWLIKASLPNYGVVLQVIDFDLENSTSCNNDYVKIYNDYSSYGQTATKLCGHISNETFVSSGSVLSVNFRTDSTVVHTGFKFAYSSQELQVLCKDVHLTAMSDARYISSPNYPNKYLNNLNCTWYITTTSPNVIRLQSLSFQVEGSFYDYLVIYNGPYLNSQMSHMFNVPGTNIDYVSTGNSVAVKFVTDGSANYTGFQLKYTSQPRTALCGALTRSATSFASYISSPTYSGSFPNNLQCEWHIQADYSSVVVLNLNNFYINDAPPCSRKYLAIYDGNSVTSKSLGRLCGSVPEQTHYTSIGHYLTVVYFSDSSVATTEFQLSYSSETAAICNGETLYTKAYDQYIDSQNYPNKYASNTDCKWLITTSSDSEVVHVSFDSFELEGTYPSCLNDYVVIYDGPSTSSKKLATLCGYSNYDTYTSSDKDMLIVFHTDGLNNYGGFKLAYRYKYVYEGLSDGAIAAIVICSLAVPVIVIGVVICCRKYSARKQPRNIQGNAPVTATPNVVYYVSQPAVNPAGANAPQYPQYPGPMYAQAAYNPQMYPNPNMTADPNNYTKSVPVPDQSNFAPPTYASLAPQGVTSLPQGQNGVPQGAFVLPQGTTVASQGANIAPQGVTGAH